MNNTNTTDNEKRIDKKVTNEVTKWDFQLPHMLDEGPSLS